MLIPFRRTKRYIQIECTAFTDKAMAEAYIKGLLMQVFDQFGSEFPL